MKTIVTIFVGIILGGASLFGIYQLYSTVHADHIAIGQVVNFLNSQIQASQKITK